MIGVSGYTKGWKKLPGVKEDVKALKKALEENGFQVETMLDPDSNRLEAAFEDFIEKYGKKTRNRLLFWFAPRFSIRAPPLTVLAIGYHSPALHPSMEICHAPIAESYDDHAPAPIRANVRRTIPALRP